MSRAALRAAVIMLVSATDAETTKTLPLRGNAQRRKPGVV
jgi:hypothetical protein